MSFRRADDWLRVTQPGVPLLAQGWKLHVSALTVDAVAVLERALPVLLAHGATFKVASTLLSLEALNHGDAGETQVGKFITVYPVGEADAVALALPLHRATAGLQGPRVPTDRVLIEGSLVSYRYGGFGGLSVQMPIGEVVPAITDPHGSAVPDRRARAHYAPDWAADPFAAAGFGADDTPRPVETGGRYRPLVDLSRTPRSTVSLAIDLEDARRCVIKRTAVAIGRERFRNEARMLARLAGDPRFPALYDLVEDDREVALVLEDIVGRTLEDEVGMGLPDGRLPEGGAVARLGRAVALALAEVHRRGIVYRDLKSTNVLVEKDGTVRLIDFELASLADGSSPVHGQGTPGYMSPAQRAGQPPTPADDVYSLGALLYLLATGAEPSLAPDQANLLARPIRWLNPAIAPALERIVGRCLDPDPARRYGSASAAAAALARVEGRAAAAAPAIGEERAPSRQTQRRMTAHALADTLVADAFRTLEGLAWQSTHDQREGIVLRDINLGCAGTVIALSAAVEAFDDRLHRDTLAEAAAWLASSQPFPGGPLPGLYIGELGVAVALARAGQALGDRGLLDVALDHADAAAALPHASPDLFNGTAGRARAHLSLWAASGDGAQLDAARAAGEVLVASAEPVDGGLRWTIPSGYGGLSDHAYLGYAHGVAGIADVLLELWLATGETRFRDVAKDGFELLARRARPASDGGVNWTSLDEGGPRGALWCHGAAGVGRAMLRAARLEVIPEAASLAERAARTVARGSRIGSAVRCHGLAGTIEFLVDVAQATGERWPLEEARSHARLLDAFVRRRPDGHAIVPSESPDVVTPDYMVGYAGIIPALLRLIDPDRPTPMVI